MGFGFGGEAGKRARAPAQAAQDATCGCAAAGGSASHDARQPTLLASHPCSSSRDTWRVCLSRPATAPASTAASCAAARQARRETTRTTAMRVALRGPAAIAGLRAQGLEKLYEPSSKNSSGDTGEGYAAVLLRSAGRGKGLRQEGH